MCIRRTMPPIPFAFHPIAPAQSFPLAMKLQDPSQFESERQQERRARGRIRPKALFYSALIAGVIVFIVPAGPWMSHESMFAAMGRPMISSATADMVIHLGMALVYG